MTHESPALLAAIVNAMARLRGTVAVDSAGDIQLTNAAGELQHLASSPLWLTSHLRAASLGEELLYELSVNPGAPSLYLVSDGVGVASLPHCHETWAIIAGIRGRELNVFFRSVDASDRSVAPTRSAIVGVGQTLSLTQQSIHATQVVGSEATFHLHLYGRPLSELTSFESRCYVSRVS